MNISPPPINDFVIDQEGKANLSWILFFNSLYEGDTGEEWTPTAVSLGSVGTPTLTGRYYRIGRRLAYFRIVITPATSTTSTAATTYIDNFPLTMAGDGICFAVSGGTGTNSGHCVSANNRIFLPAWSAVTLPISIIGMAEVR